MTNATTQNDRASLSVDGAIATLTLNRPSAYNAMDLDMARALRRLVTEVEGNEQVRVLVIHGVGAGFCAGGDIAFVANHVGQLPVAVGEFMAEFSEFLQALSRMPKVVLVAVHGTVAGAGLSLALMGDLCVAADDTRFLPAYAKLGVTPDCGGTIGVVRAVGVRKAMQLFLMEDLLTGPQALAFGLVNRLYPASELMAGARAVAERLAGFNPEVLGPTKRLLSQSPHTAMALQIDEEKKALLACMRTPSYLDAVNRFVNK